MLMFNGRSRRFWIESEKLEYPWGIYNLQKNPAAVSSCLKNPQNVPLFWIILQNIVREKCVVLEVSPPEKKWFSEQSVTAGRIFLRILVLLLHDSKSYSRGVLTDLKVLPSKSMSSQDYFTYICYGHIFNISKDRPHFVKKFTLLVCYIQIYHVWISQGVTSSWLSM